MKDKLGKEFQVGQYVAKAYYSGDLRILRVTKIIGDNIYLGQSTNALIYPHSVLILEGDYGDKDDSEAATFLRSTRD